MASLANHTQLPGQELWVGLLCLSQSTERDVCRQEVKKKKGLTHQFPVRHNPGVLAVELRQNGEVFSPSPFAMASLVQPWRSDRLILSST